MDARQPELEGKLGEILKQAADVASQIQAIEQGPGTPHYDHIEIPAHEVGQRPSRMVQANRTGEAGQKAFVADGLTCNWSIHAEHFEDYVPILDVTHAVSYLFNASMFCLGKSEQAWQVYCGWTRAAWRGDSPDSLSIAER